MRAALLRLTGDSLVYGLGQVSGRAVQLLLVPILTRVLTPPVYGVADLVLAYSQFAVLVLVFGMDGALVRFFYQEPDAEARRRMVSTGLWFRLSAGLIAGLLLWAAAGPLADRLVGSDAYRKYVTVGALTLPFTLLALYANDVLRVTFQPKKFIALNFAQTVVAAAVSLYLVLSLELGVVGVLYGKLAGDVAAALLGLVLMRHYLMPKLEAPTLRRMLRFGAPLVPAALGYGVVSAADRYFLQHARGLEEVGVYAVAVKFFALTMMSVSAFSLAFFPFAHARAEDPGAPRLVARVFALYVTVACAGAMAAALFAPEVLAVLVPPEYHAAAGPAALLTFAAVAYGAYYVACLGLQRALKTEWLGATAALGAVVAIVANALLTPRFGGMGAAAATLLGNLARAVSTYAVSQAVHPFPYRGPRLAVLFGAGLALAWFGQRAAAPGAAGWGLKLAAIAAFVAASWMLGVWSDRGAVRREE